MSISKIGLHWLATMSAMLLVAGQLFAADDGAAAGRAGVDQGPQPKIEGGLPVLNGTAWRIDFGKGPTGTLFLFLKSGRWEIVPVGSIGAVGKSYRVEGDVLTTVNADDGKVEKFKMKWTENVLELDDGKSVLRLHYNGETTS